MKRPRVNTASLGSEAARPVALALATLLSSVPAMRAQSVVGQVEGRVLDGDSLPVSDIAVTATSPSLQGTRTTLTDSRGAFRLQALPVGSYTVRLEHIAYRAVTFEAVRVGLGRTTTLGLIRVEAEPVRIEEVIVVGDRPLIDPTTTALDANVEAEYFETLPVSRDSYRSVIEILPNANQSFNGDAVNIAGSTGLENVYYIDGANVTDPFAATTGTDLPYNFIKTIEVKQAGYQAEYGKANGGITNVVTRSGGNRFRVDGFGFLSGSGMSATSTTGPLGGQPGSFSTFDVGLSIGGPIARDRLWYFLAYNPLMAQRSVELPQFGFFDDQITSHRFAAKLNWQAARSTEVVLSFFGDPTSRDIVDQELIGFFGVPASLGNPDPFLGSGDVGSANVALQSISALNSKLLLEVTLAYYSGKEGLFGATPVGREEPLFRDLTTGEWSGGVGTERDIGTSRASARVVSTLLLGAHTLKGGVAYENNVVDVKNAFTAPGSLEKSADSAFLAVTLSQDFTAKNRVPTFFVQDSWQVGNRVRLNYGLRWDGQYFIGAADSVGQAITNQWQPRLGLIVLPGRPGTQKVVASFGRYYQQFPLTTPAGQVSVWDQTVDLYSTDPRQAGAVPDASIQITPTDRPPGDKLPGIRGEHFDELTLGYELALLDPALKFGVRGIYRTLRESYALGFDPSQSRFILGNPGRGELDFLPRPTREYAALELTVGRTGAKRLNFLFAYVLSRTHGNYAGLFSSDQGFAFPGNYFSLALPEQAENSTGLLPNDRTHVFKLSGSYVFDFGLTAGTFFTVASGTPLNEFGASSLIARPVFLVQRGSAGRTSTIWDWNIRATYDVGRAGTFAGRIILDILHIGNPQTAVRFDQIKFLALDGNGNQILPNPNFGAAITHQQPMQARLGFEVAF